jgi:TetR/AcrR family transcriptional repressor of nem operon
MSTDTTSDSVRQHILDTASGILAYKGFTAMGLNELLQTAGVPKGSFYHYFASKEAFGEALLESYFDGYLDELDGILSHPGASGLEQLMAYFLFWTKTQAQEEMNHRCLAVKLSAEVSDLSEAMREVLRLGTSSIVARLAEAIGVCQKEGSIAPERDPEQLAETLYHLWLGASLRAKLTRNRDPFDRALDATREMLRWRAQK